jgi:predicted nucleic acid-binding protein
MLVDTGVVVAMGNRRDDDHDRCTKLLTTTLELLAQLESATDLRSSMIAMYSD